MKKRKMAKARDKPDDLRWVKDYCSQNLIRHSSNCHSFYFWYKGLKYRVSDHPRSFFAVDDDVFSILVSHPWEVIIDIHQAVVNGNEIDSKGRVIRSA